MGTFFIGHLVVKSVIPMLPGLGQAQHILYEVSYRVGGMGGNRRYGKAVYVMCGPCGNACSLLDR